MSQEQLPEGVARARELRRLAGLPASLVVIELIAVALQVLQRNLAVPTQSEKDGAAPPAA